MKEIAQVGKSWKESMIQPRSDYKDALLKPVRLSEKSLNFLSYRSIKNEYRKENDRSISIVESSMNELKGKYNKTEYFAPEVDNKNLKPMPMKRILALDKKDRSSLISQSPMLELSNMFECLKEGRMEFDEIVRDPESREEIGKACVIEASIIALNNNKRITISGYNRRINSAVLLKGKYFRKPLERVLEKSLNNNPDKKVNKFTLLSSSVVELKSKEVLEERAFTLSEVKSRYVKKRRAKMTKSNRKDKMRAGKIKRSKRGCWCQNQRTAWD
jgi:hypothetical protein